MTDLRYLEAFHTAAQTLNFTRAAERLQISASALSRQIQLLEESVGGELFVRTTRKVNLTPLGSRLFTVSATLFRELSGLNADRTIRIGCLQSVFEFVFTGIMERNPGVFSGPLDITIASPRILREKLVAGELDLILTHLPPTRDSHLSGFKLYEESLDWIGAQRKGGSFGRPIILSAFENVYPDNALAAPDRIRINSFSGAVALANKKIGRAFVAFPTKKHDKKPHRQWIYVVSQSYKTLPAYLKEIFSVLRQEAASRRF